jgi:hypothetical protein
MCNEKGIASKFADLRDDAVHPRSDILSGFPIGTRLGENSPTRHRFTDFCCREAFVFPVIPLTEILSLDGLPSPTDKIACPPRTKTGAAENETKVPIFQEGGKGDGSPLAFPGEWNIGDRGVASTQAPIRFPMADQHDALTGFGLGRFGHGKLSRRLKSGEVAVDPTRDGCADVIWRFHGSKCRGIGQNLHARAWKVAAEIHGITRMEPSSLRWPEDMNRGKNTGKVVGHIKAMAFSEKIKNRVFGTILLCAIDEHAQGLRSDFLGICKSAGFEPQAHERSLGDMTTVYEVAQPGDAAFTHHAHGSTFL